MTAAQVEVVAVAPSLVRTGEDRGELEVRWRFANGGDAPAWVLVRQPMDVGEGDPVVLDHSAGEPSPEANAERPPVFLEVAGHAAVEHRMRYHLALRPGVTGVRAVGRFGFGLTPPDASWSQHPSWGPMRRWQKVAESTAFESPSR